ncbi:MAG: hypothetical protein HYZ58_04365 [Acidobacteria bacterium]|nr:hypothetical protein [Acidobacteriota bacterium]MBI3262368.1 hypothetical protein [Acidobacteriota bacterium]
MRLADTGSGLPDGKRFLMIKQQRSTGGAQFVVIENWFDELKARVR